MFKHFFLKISLICILLFGLVFVENWAEEMKEKEDRTAKTDFISFHRIDKAWKYTKGKNTKIAILDWLFDLSPEAAKKYVNPTSMIPGQKIGFAEPWHGEWMAEIVHQIAPEAKIIPIRANPGKNENEKSAGNEKPYEKYLRKGIRFAADQGAAAVTNSMGPVKHCEALSEAVAYAEKRGTVFINVHPEYLVYTKQTYKKCETGQCNKKIIHTGLVSVPKYPVEPESNRDIYVWPYQPDPKFRDGWGYSNGPPIVGGVVALMRSVNPKLTPEEIKNIIIATGYLKNGFRILDAEACVLEAIKRNKGRGAGSLMK